jgi:hypothetical protein
MTSAASLGQSVGRGDFISEEARGGQLTGALKRTGKMVVVPYKIYAIHPFSRTWQVATGLP